jgi:stringent starvation protein B
MVHPVQSVIESLYAAGRCPRIHVNAIYDDVVCPDFIREQWKEQLVIDLDANYPLDLSFDDCGISADLSFGGYVTRCSFPWGAIFVVVDRNTGRGIVLDRNMPESVRRKRELQGGPGQRSALRSVSVTDEPSADSSAEGPLSAVTSIVSTESAEESDPRPLSTQGQADEMPDGAAANPSAEEASEQLADEAPKESTPEEPTPEDAEASPDKTDSRAKKRRAAFKVIDGGG